MLLVPRRDAQKTERNRLSSGNPHLSMERAEINDKVEIRCTFPGVGGINTQRPLRYHSSMGEPPFTYPSVFGVSLSSTSIPKFGIHFSTRMAHFWSDRASLD